jgi:hypothetical protein
MGQAISSKKAQYVAAVVTGLMAFALSLLWYSPLLFGKVWQALRDAPVNPLPGWTFAFAPLREIITAFMLAYLIVRLRIVSWKSACGLGLGLWFAFYFVQLAGGVLWDNRPLKLGMVHGGDWLMKMVFMSVVLCAWLRRLRHGQGPEETAGSSR